MRRSALSGYPDICKAANRAAICLVGQAKLQQTQFGPPTQHYYYCVLQKKLLHRGENRQCFDKNKAKQISLLCGGKLV